MEKAEDMDISEDVSEQSAQKEDKHSTPSRKSQVSLLTVVAFYNYIRSYIPAGTACLSRGVTGTDLSIISYIYTA